MSLLHHIIYQSKATEEFSIAQLREQLVHFRVYNSAHAITGVLLYTPDGQFMQVLEGEEAAVTQLFYNRIMHDRRHSDISILSEGPWAHRGFSNWSMGFVSQQHAELPPEPGFMALHTLRVVLPQMVPDRPALVHLLLEFLDQHDDRRPAR